MTVRDFTDDELLDGVAAAAEVGAEGAAGLLDTLLEVLETKGALSFVDELVARRYIGRGGSD